MPTAAQLVAGGFPGRVAWNKGNKFSSPCRICGKMVEYSKYGKKVATCSIVCLIILKKSIAKNYSPPSRLGQRISKARHKRITTQGYIELYEGDTPAFRKLEHRSVMEDFLERKLDRKEHVHHIDGDKTNNSIGNLLLMDIREHGRLHSHGRSFKNG